MDKHKILHTVSKALDAQFEIYNWEDMISDTDLTPKEKKWATENICYKAYVFETGLVYETSGKHSSQHKKSQILADTIIVLIFLTLAFHCLVQQIRKTKYTPFRKQAVVNSIFEEDMRGEIMLTPEEIEILNKTNSRLAINQIYEKAKTRAYKMRVENDRTDRI